MTNLDSLIKPPHEPSACVCCGEPDQTGRYLGLPVCFPCYQTGLLREWLDQNGAQEWEAKADERTQIQP